MSATAASLAFAAVGWACAAWLGWRLHGGMRRARVLARGGDAHAATRDAALLEQAIAQERERIYGDLHDDLGAKLLTLIYQAESPLQADLARATLQDLRDVVTRSRGTPGTLGDVLADIRGEATQRLAAVGIGLAWEAESEMPDPPLDTARALHLYRIVREAISNVIRHAHARRLRVRVRCSGDALRLELTDDGAGSAPQPSASGSGMRNMRDRASELAGEIQWTPGTEGGTKVLLAMPLGPPPPPA